MELGVDIRVDYPDGSAAAQRLYQAWRERCPVYLSLTKAMPVATRVAA